MIEYENLATYNLQCCSDEQVYNATGIRDWSSRYPSFTKILCRHGIFLHDELGIYFVDQLALTFTSFYNHLFFRNPKLYADNDFEKRFNITDELVLVEESGKGLNYYHRYTIEYMGRVFGSLFLHQTGNPSLSRIQIANEILYTVSPISIVSVLVEVASRLELVFSNYCNYDVAHDTLRNYYHEMGIILYQSDFCAAEVHDAHNSAPIYTFHGRRRTCHHTVDVEDNTLGTITIGSKNSASDVKLYTKTPDNEKKGKSYITQIHNQFFGEGASVYRVEGCCRSEFFLPPKPFGNRRLDLLDLLMPENLKRNLKDIVGDKLKFKKIAPCGWDKNRNSIHEKFELINFTESQATLKIEINTPPQTVSQKKEIEGFKELAYRYMEGRIPFLSLLMYAQSECRSGDPKKIRNMVQGIDRAKRNFKHHVSTRKTRRLNRLVSVLRKSGATKNHRFRLYWLLF